MRSLANLQKSRYMCSIVSGGNRMSDAKMTVASSMNFVSGMMDTRSWWYSCSRAATAGRVRHRCPCASTLTSCRKATSSTATDVLVKKDAMVGSFPVPAPRSIKTSSAERLISGISLRMNSKGSSSPYTVPRLPAYAHTFGRLSVMALMS